MEGFNEQDLRGFCFDAPGFRPVYDQFSRNSSKSDIIQGLLEHVERQDLVETLLAWAKKENPAKYKEHAPYFHRSGGASDKPGGSKGEKAAGQHRERRYHHKNYVIRVRGDSIPIRLDPGRYRFLVKNVNPDSLPLSHPEFTWKVVSAGKAVAGSDTAENLRNIDDLREFTSPEFSTPAEAELIIDIACHTAISKIVRVGQCHVRVEVTKLE